MDYIFFFYGTSFIVLAVICFLFKRIEKKPVLPWHLLGLFGLTHGLHEWLDIIISNFGANDLLLISTTFFVFLSYLFLLEFGRKGYSRLSGRHLSVWIDFPFLIAALAGSFYGVSFVEGTIRYFLGFPGGLFSAIVILSAAKKAHDKDSRPPLLALGAAIGAYALSTGLVAPPSAFIFTRWINTEIFLRTFGFPIQLVRGICAFISAAAILWYFQQCMIAAAASYLYKVKQVYSFWIFPALILVFICGYIGVEISHSVVDRLYVISLTLLVIALMVVFFIFFERLRIASARTAASEKRFFDIASSSADMLWEVDADGRYTYCSDHVIEVLGYSPEEMMGKTVFDIAPEEEQGSLKSVVAEIRNNKRPLVDWENRALRKDGSEVVLLTNGVPILDFKGDLIGYRGVDKNITDRKRAEEELKRNFDTQQVINSLLRLSLTDISLDGFLKRALDVIVSIPWLSFESAGRAFRGCIFLVEDQPDLLVMKAQRGMSNEIQERCSSVPFGKCLCGMAASEKKIVFTDKMDEGHEISYHGIVPHGHYCVPIMSSDRLLGLLNMYVKEGYQRDKRDEDFLSIVANTLAGVIDRKHAERDLRVHREKLEELVKERTEELRKTNEQLVIASEEATEASRAKTEFIHNMNHELRTPLNSVLGFAQVLDAEYCGKMNEKQKEYVKYILDSGQHLLSLINDVLDMSKIEAGSMELDIGPVDLQYILEHAKVMMKEKALVHSIKLLLNVSPDLPAEFKGDERKIKQVLFNFLSNAFKFTPDNGSIVIDAKKISPGEIEISVTDSGLGISESDQKKIFNPFVQLDKKKAGTGLGLSLSKKIVDLWNGKIGVVSPPEGRERGCRFYFTIPI